METKGCLFENRCILEVAVNLASVAIIRFFVIGNVKEIVLPLALKAVNAFKIGAGPLVQLKNMLTGKKAAAAESAKDDGAVQAEAKVG